MKIYGNVSSGNTASTSQDNLSRIGVGDHINAKVLDISGNSLTLRLPDGTVFQAATLSPLNANIGEFLNFTVTQTNDAQVFLETTKAESTNANTQDNIQKALTSLGLKDSSENRDAIKAMLEQKIPITEENFTKLTGMSKQSGLDLIKSAFLLANEIPANETNIQQLTSMLENKYALGNKLGNLQNLVMQNSSPELQNQLSETIQSTEITKLRDLISSASQIAGVALAENSDDENTAGPTSNQTLTDIVKNLINQIKTGSIKNTPLASNLIQNLEGQLELVNSMLNSLNSSDTGSKDSVLNMLFAKLQDGLKPSELHVPTKYNDILTRLHALKDAVNSGNISNPSEILSQIRNIEDGLSFLKDINANQTFVHIPVNFEYKNTTCELYVLRKNPKRKKIDPENATMFLSLETENMGQVESLVNIQNKNITMNLRLDNQEVISHFKENFKDLYQILDDVGYKIVDIRYKIIDTDINVVNASAELQREAKSHIRKLDCKI